MASLKIRDPRFPKGLLCGLLVACVALAGAGCSSSDEVAPKVSAPVASKASTPQSMDAELVAAVSLEQGTAPVGLRFQLLDRPAAGKAFSVRLRVAPAQAVDSLQATFEPTQGLTLTGPASFRAAGIALGETRDHTLGLRAAVPGVFEIRVRVSLASLQGPSSAVFSVPVMVDAPDAAAR
jgi:hypothetical protein